MFRTGISTTSKNKDLSIATRQHTGTMVEDFGPLKNFKEKEYRVYCVASCQCFCDNSFNSLMPSNWTSWFHFLKVSVATQPLHCRPTSSSSGRKAGRKYYCSNARGYSETENQMRSCINYIFFVLTLTENIFFSISTRNINN